MLLAERKELEEAVRLLESAKRYCEKGAHRDLGAFHAYTPAAHVIQWRAHLVRKELRAFDAYGKRWHDVPNSVA